MKQVGSIIKISVIILLAVIILLVLKFTADKTAGTTTPVSMNKKKETDSIKYAKGQAIFKQHCNNCHNFYKTDNYLIGVVGKWPGINELKDFIKSPDSSIKKSNYAKAVADEYAPARMPGFLFLSDDDLEAIVVYMSVESKQKN